ncbi:unnamed protein product [Ectocarpus sp. 13 AM-2016]
MYDRLRGSYNSCRPSRSRPVPPLEEWHGVDAFCDDLYCRAKDLGAQKLKAFWAPPSESMAACVGTRCMDSDEGETAFQGHWENQTGTLSACNIAQKIPGGVPASSTRGESERREGSTLVSTAPIASPASSNNPCRLLTKGLSFDHVESKADSLVVAPESLSRLPDNSEGSGEVEDTEEGSIGAGDWLDVTHAMLDALGTH